ncbi:PREDICTED: LOW QUALITY PROTEIN: CMP-sialic acid transporter 1-like [Priapulus caudatus]|uniref:LOW QUALITY PROTEIN: CMP-sialic acid transporter 1-like n=1 Tax=Priapulus caudatus TaxID=37621 RepID=A0ABM1EIF9_PRICU|nr:PREDICTED: LOW QUALITY PROTEIN: CMP-sialic acid transporter 1-like [Priapulus caudatus]
MDSNKYNIIQQLKVLSPDLFPTTWSFVVFILYMALFINQGILVTSTKNSDKSYDYNVTTVVLLTECLKLIISTILYVKGNGLVKIKSEVLQNTKVLCLYFVPAFLYCLYNNLQFVNLAEYDPTTYYLLLQFRVVVTGVVFQYLLKDVGASTPIMLQNVFMYVDSIVCNVVLLICRGKLLDAFKPDALASIYKVSKFCVCV